MDAFVHEKKDRHKIIKYTSAFSDSVVYNHMVCGCLNVNLPAVTLGRNLRGPQLQKRRQGDKQDNERQTTDWAWKAA